MTTVVIDLYDSGILISDGMRVLASSPSYALVEADGRIIVGAAAMQQAHLRPREISTLYWEQLAANSNTEHVVSNAELALEHLRSVWGQVATPDTPAILTTPNTISKQDLGLLLGVCEKISIPVQGIASRAVLALQGLAPGYKVVFLDVLQQLITITEIHQQGNHVFASLTNTLLKHGMQSLSSRLATYIAEKFIAQTRFDPMHIAKDTQQFFDKLPICLASLATRPTTKCTLDTATGEYRIELQKDQLLAINQPVLNEITGCLQTMPPDQQPLAIICSPACSQVFGLHDYCNALPGCAMVALSINDIANQALLYKEQIGTNDEQVHYTTDLMWNHYAAPLDLKPNHGALSGVNQAPSHVLIDAEAYPLLQKIYLGEHANKITVHTIKNAACVCKIYMHGGLPHAQNLNGRKILLNGTPLTTQLPVRIGDQVYFMESKNELRFIKVN